MQARSFVSNAEEIRYYVKQLLEDGAAHKREDILAYIRRHAPNGERFTEGMLSGAIRDLLKNSDGLYFSPARGKYQKARQSVVPNMANVEYDHVKDMAVGALQGVCRELSSICTVNLLTYTGRDIMPLIDQIRETCQMINDRIDAIGRL